MSVVPTSAVQSVSGLTQAERVEVRDKDKKTEREKARLTPQDEFERRVRQVEASEAVRTLKSNDQEEAHEDREGHADPHAAARSDDHRHLDLSA